MMNVVRNVIKVAEENGVTNVDTLVLQIGELSPVIPRFIRACYPAAVDGTMLQDTKLQIDVLPGNGICSKCSKVFNLLENQKKCPGCQSSEWEILCGKEFFIKEIIAC